MQKRPRSLKRPKIYPQKCWFCDSKTEPGYTDTSVLGRFVTERGKIIDRGKTGLCSRHQRRVTTAIKRARHVALLPFVVRA